jgi:hypothetical protein
MYVAVLLMLAAVVAAAFHFRVVLREEPWLARSALGTVYRGCDMLGCER